MVQYRLTMRGRPRLLNENQVVDAVGTYLEWRHFHVPQKLRTSQPGIDIIAQFPDRKGELWVEAKGATSSKPGSKRFKLGFSGSQRKDHVANAVYTALSYISRSPGTRPRRAGIAVPLDHREKLVDPVLATLSKLGVVVFLVSTNGDVEVIGNLE